MDKKSDYFTPTPPMSDAVKALLPSGVEEEFRRAFADGNIDFFFDSINAGMADAEANPAAALQAVKKVLGNLLVAVIQRNCNPESKLGPFGKYEGPDDIKDKWANLCGSADALFPNANGGQIRQMFDVLVKWICNLDEQAVTPDTTAPSVEHASVRLVGNLLVAIGCYLYEVERSKFPF